MIVYIGCDHGGYNLKSYIISCLEEMNISYQDIGTYNDQDSVDYPDYAAAVAHRVAFTNDYGILICGTGIGISIAANKVDGIRCAHVTDAYQAKMTKEHNNANIIALGGRITTPDDAMAITKAFFSATFAGGRHQNRIDKISLIEKNLL